MLGEIDIETNFPVVPVTINGREVSCLVDTGFNGYLWTDSIIARHLLGIEVLNRVDGTSQIADGSFAEFEIVRVDVPWFGRLFQPSLQVVFTIRNSKFPVVLGTRMLIGYVLIVDFNHGIVQIRNPDVYRVSP